MIAVVYNVQERSLRSRKRRWSAWPGDWRSDGGWRRKDIREYDRFTIISRLPRPSSVSDDEYSTRNTAFRQRRKIRAGRCRRLVTTVGRHNCTEMESISLCYGKCLNLYGDEVEKEFSFSLSWVFSISHHFLNGWTLSHLEIAKNKKHLYNSYAYCTLFTTRIRWPVLRFERFDNIVKACTTVSRLKLPTESIIRPDDLVSWRFYEFRFNEISFQMSHLCVEIVANALKVFRTYSKIRRLYRNQLL